jgi:demethylmenaquinone methyltransferase/2-methoxy-6-polyprenyl-1,4-benzoquinol methylase
LSDSIRDLLDEQVAYYRARAAEYDATSTPDGNPFARHDKAIRLALASLDLRGRVLELAAGTGQWTGMLADTADELLVTDASPEMLELNRAKLGERGAIYRVADVFSLEAAHAHDVVFFGFFLSHVPPGRFEAFWSLVDGLLAPTGRAVFVDEGVHFEWREDWIDGEAGIVRRTLQDGSVHRAAKVLWRPEELEQRLFALGWSASVSAEGPFYWGTAATS